MRKQILLVLEEMPLDEKVRRGNVLIKTRPRDVEETLLQLINDDDQVIAACAIDVVGQHKVWALADDIEHVLAHRDVRDWYVFEAASWALAEKRMPTERRRELWHEPLPAAELASRLRNLPLFASMSVDELFRLTGAGRQVRHDPGSVLLQEGAVPESIHLLLDGGVTASSRNGAPRRLEAPMALGFSEALSGTAMAETLRTVERAVTLVLTVEELRTLLSDNTDLVTGLFTTLAGRAGDAEAAVHPTHAGAEFEALVDRRVRAGRKGAGAAARSDLLARVCRGNALSRRYRAGCLDEGWRATLHGIHATRHLVTARRRSRAGKPTGAPPLTARGGDVIGSMSTMAGQGLGRSANVRRDVVALRLDREDCCR